jgi:hypothetical protein
MDAVAFGVKKCEGTKEVGVKTENFVIEEGEKKYELEGEIVRAGGFDLGAVVEVVVAGAVGERVAVVEVVEVVEVVVVAIVVAVATRVEAAAAAGAGAGAAFALAALAALRSVLALIAVAVAVAVAVKFAFVSSFAASLIRLQKAVYYYYC